MKDQVTDGLKTRLQSLSDFHSAIEDDPLALLTAIKTAVHENVRSQHPPATLHLHWDRLLCTKQANSEDPPTYAKYFEQQLDTVKGHLGPRFTDGFTEHMPEYKANAYKDDVGTSTIVIETHIMDEDQCKACATDLLDIFSHYKPKETPDQLAIKANVQSKFEAHLLLCSVDQAKCCWKEKNDVAKLRQAGTAPTTGATIYCLTSL